MHCFEFGNYKLIPGERLLLRDGVPVPLPPKAFDTLELLAENEGHLLEKDFFLDRVWADSYVEEATLAKTVSTLRKALDENDEHKYIETVPKSGYRFVAEVRRVEADVGVRIAPVDSSLERQVPDATSVSADAPSAGGGRGRSFLHSELLSRPVLSLIFISVIAGAVSLFTSWNTKSSGDPEIGSIAVIPFSEIGTSEKDEILQFGMTDTLITRLSRLREIAVRPTDRIARYSGTSLSAEEIGRELAVDAVLTGSIQKRGDRLRVNVQLVSTADGTTIWAERFDTALSNIFEIQDSIARQTVESLAPRLGASAAPDETRSFTADSKAYELYARGRFHWNKRTVDSLGKAIGNFEQALASDPDFALAYAGLADCYQLLAEYQALAPRDAFPKAREAARQALSLDEGLAEAHTSLAYTLAFFDREFVQAETQFRRAIELDPNYATGHQWYGEFLAALGRFEEAEKELELAVQLDPTSLIIQSDLAGYYYFTRQYDRSIRKSDSIVDLDPRFPYGLVFKWLALRQKGDLRGAAETYIKATELFGEPDAAAELRRVLSESGIEPMWKKRLDQVNSPGRLASFPEIQRGMLYMRTNDRERAFKSFEAAVDRRERWAVNLKFSPEVDPLRSDPRFDKLIEKLGIANPGRGSR